MRKAALIVALIAIGVLVTPFCLQALDLFTWSRINCREEYLDINSGRMRIQRWYWYLLLSDHTQETAISRFAPNAADHDFQPVNTFSFLKPISPHYHFHGVDAQFKLIEDYWESNDVADSERREHVKKLMEIWRTRRGSVAAYDYIWSLSENGGNGT
jgi:hypothetical protein